MQSKYQQEMTENIAEVKQSNTIMLSPVPWIGEWTEHHPQGPMQGALFMDSYGRAPNCNQFNTFPCTLGVRQQAETVRETQLQSSRGRELNIELLLECSKLFY